MSSVSMLTLYSLPDQGAQSDGFWPYLIHHPVAIVGILIAFGGIIVGNMGMWGMMDAATEHAPPSEMFSTGEQTNPISPQSKRNQAITKYRETQPDGPFYKMLKSGQVVTVAGALIMLVGAFI